MERDARPPVATFYHETAGIAGGAVTLGEGPAHHARVKRLKVGDPVRLSDGGGHLSIGSIAVIGRNALDVAVAHVDDIDPPLPIHLRVPIGDRDRMLWLAEKATELGVTSWQAVRFRRSASVSPRGEGTAFMEKVRARMIAALEQSGSAWLPKLLPDAAASSLAHGPDQFPVLLHIDGAPLHDVAKDRANGEPVLLFGPEGGIEPDELDALTSRGWRKARLASTALRFETAGIAAVAVIRSMFLNGER